jgi:hypothetical protein
MTVFPATNRPILVKEISKEYLLNNPVEMIRSDGECRLAHTAKAAFFIK